MCNYPTNLIDDGIKKALTIDRENLLKPETISQVKEDRIILVSTHNPNIRSKSDLIKGIFNVLQTNPRTKNSFLNKNLLFSKRKPNNLKEILTRARFDLGSQNVDVKKCNKPRCQICNIGNNCW